MNKLLLISRQYLLASCCLLPALAAKAQFTNGNIVVVQVGDGAAALTNGSTVLSLKEYNTTTTSQASPVSVVTIPSTGTHRLLMGGTASSEGFITLSADSLRLTIAGYDTTVGVASINGTTSVAVPRVIDTLSYRGIPGRAAVTTTNFTTSNFRGAVKTTGENYYGSGNGSTGLGGVYYLGQSAPAASIQTSVNNARTIQAFNGNLYFSTGSAPIGIYKITGYPTAAATPSLLIGSVGTGASPYSFAINSTETVAYIADDRTVANGGGIQKWVYTAGSWGTAPVDTFSVGGTTLPRGLAVDWSGTYPVIYATTSEASGNRLVKIVDSNTNATFALLATAPANTAFRGVTFAPKVPPACTTPVLGTTITPYTCSGNGAVTVSVTSGTTPATWSWTGPSSFIAGTQNISGLVAGTYNLTATTPGGCSATASAIVTNNAVLPADTINTAAGTGFCTGDSVRVKAVTGAGFTYQWNNTSGVIAGATDSVYWVKVAGNYTVTVSAGINCTTTSIAKTITENPMPVIMVTRLGADTLCSADTVMLKTNSGAGYSYNWSFNGTTLSGHTDSILKATPILLNPVITPLLARAVVTTSFGCKDSSATFTFVLYPIPEPVATYTGGILSTGTFATYQWYRNGTAVSGATSQTHTPGANGNYAVLVTNEAGCDSMSASVTVTGVGVSTINGAAIKLYPNPAKNMLYIQSPVAVDVVVRDLQGRIVLSGKNVKQISLTGISNGVYAVSVYEQNGLLITTKRMIKAD